MKQTLLLLSIPLFFTKGSFVYHHTSNLEASLVAYYSFNQCDARDDSGNGSDGQLFGGISCWCGIEDDGLLLDGVNDYIEFHGKVNRYFSTSDFTISFYFKAEQYQVFPQSLLSKRLECTEYQMLDLLLNMNKREVETGVHETPEKFYAGISPPIGQTNWVHYALVREGFRAFTYINGVLVRESFRCSGVDISNDAVFSFSNSPCIYGGNARRFKGVLDELRVFDRALSEEEIKRLYLMYPVENAQMDCVS
ncbi:MAG TPA: LamG domain-containing protein [Saprospiraceae bacterium]|nr:LamG domain-containing protein [Saprospiraceae bacterium]HMQ83734.1 LamG domain-containing protein [Saprospiraceae bacterium]